MSILLTEEDERDLTEFLVEELGAKLLLNDLAPKGSPNVAEYPLSALPKNLPSRPFFGGDNVYSLLFWLPECGDIQTMASAPQPESAHKKVARKLTLDSAGDNFNNLIDQERTPILRLSRTKRISNNRLAPGQLGSMPVKVKDMPKDVKSKHGKAIRWLKRQGVQTNPFDYCPEVENRRPKNLGPLWVWVQPNAMKLVEQGMEIWPWNS